MKTIGTPNHIEVLLHCYRCPQGAHPRLNSLAVAEAHEELHQAGAIRPCPISNSYKTTELGKAWVQMLCETPPPRMVFVDTNGKIIPTGIDTES